MRVTEGAHSSRLRESLGDAERGSDKPEHFCQQHLNESTVVAVVNPVRLLACVTATTILFSSCGGSTTTPSATTFATTTTAAPAPLTTADVDTAMGTPEDMQGRSAALIGNYEFAATTEISLDDAAGLFVNAEGIMQAFSRRMTMDYVNRNNPMSVHRARGIMRIFVFDTPTNASVAVRTQGNSFGPIGAPDGKDFSFVSNDDGSRRAGRWDVRVGGDLPCLHEGLSQRGRVVAWMVVRNKNCGGWTETIPAGLADDAARTVVAQHPRFAE